MLEGLEISVLKLSELNDELRYESEFFRKPILKALQQIEAIPHQQLGELTKKIQHPVEVERIYSDSGLRLLLAQEVRSNELSLGEGSFMPIAMEPTLAANKLLEGDVVLTRSGANVGQCAPVKTTTPLFACADLLVIRKGKLPGGYLSTFLNTTQGRLLLDRGVYGMAQPHIAPTYLKTLPIPSFEAELLNAVETFIGLAEKSKTDAATNLDIAGKRLLDALKLNNRQPPAPLSYTRRSTEAFAAERFDAEYFHPAKTAAQAFLQTLPGKPLSAMFRSARELWQPESAPTNETIRNYDLNDALSPFLNDTKTPTYPAEIASTKKRLQKGDIVISRLRSYLKEIAVVQTDGKEPMVCSTEFIVLRPKAGAIPVEALLVYLRSTLPQLIFKWSQDGSNHPRFDEKELLNLHVPDIVASISQELSDSVNAATRARQRATELLEAAKRAVEIAIEDSETAALAYLKSIEEKPAP